MYASYSVSVLYRMSPSNLLLSVNHELCLQHKEPWYDIMYAPAGPFIRHFTRDSLFGDLRQVRGGKKTIYGFRKLNVPKPQRWNQYSHPLLK